MDAFVESLKQILRAEDQSSSARTVEIFGWVILGESLFLLLAPHWAAGVLHFSPLAEQAANFLRLAGLLVSGLGALYIVSGRLNAQGFVFASLLDRPLVPPIMALLWYLGVVPGMLALLFAATDSAGFLWTLRAWTREHAAGSNS